MKAVVIAVIAAGVWACLAALRWAAHAVTCIARRWLP